MGNPSSAQWLCILVFETKLTSKTVDRYATANIILIDSMTMKLYIACLEHTALYVSPRRDTVSTTMFSRDETRPRLVSTLDSIYNRNSPHEYSIKIRYFPVISVLTETFLSH